MGTFLSRTGKERAFGFGKAQQHRKYRRGERRHECGTANLFNFTTKLGEEAVLRCGTWRKRMEYINEFRLGPIHDGYEHVTCEKEKCHVKNRKKRMESPPPD